MATFTKLEQLADHGKYKGLLKTALAKVKETPQRFTYFEKHRFGDKALPLVLVDADPALVAEVKKKSGNATAIGKCRGNDQDELVFEPETGRVNRARLKKYLSTFVGVKPVWVPAAEESEESESEATPVQPPEMRATPAQTAPAQTAPVQPTRQPTAPEVMAIFNRLLPAAKQASADYPAHKAALTETLMAAQGFIKAGSLGEAQKALDKVSALLEAAKKDGGQKSGGLAAWQSARSQVVAALKDLEGKIRAMADPEGDAAIILVKSIQANLTLAPETAQQVAELERYLKTDSVLTDAEAPNGFGIKINIRQPLLEALRKLKPQA